MTQAQQAAEFDLDALKAVLPHLRPDTFTIDDLGHANHNIVAELNDWLFAVTTLIPAEGEPVQWHAGLLNAETSEPHPEYNHESGPVVDSSTPRDAALFIVAAYADARTALGL